MKLRARYSVERQTPNLMSTQGKLLRIESAAFPQSTDAKRYRVVCRRPSKDPVYLSSAHAVHRYYVTAKSQFMFARKAGDDDIRPVWISLETSQTPQL